MPRDSPPRSWALVSAIPSVDDDWGAHLCGQRSRPKTTRHRPQRRVVGGLPQLHSDVKNEPVGQGDTVDVDCEGQDYTLAPARAEALGRLEKGHREEYGNAKHVVDAWQREAAREASLFASLIKWAEMTIEHTQHTAATVPPRSAQCILTETALDIFGRVVDTLSERYGRVLLWVKEHITAAIHNTRTFPRPPPVAAMAAKVEREVEGPPLYFELYDRALLTALRFHSMNQQQRRGLASQQGVLDCAMETYRLKVKGLVFRGWRGVIAAKTSRLLRAEKLVKRCGRQLLLLSAMGTWKLYVAGEKAKKAEAAAVSTLTRTQARHTRQVEQLEKVIAARTEEARRVKQELRALQDEVADREAAHKLGKLELRVQGGQDTGHNEGWFGARAPQPAPPADTGALQEASRRPGTGREELCRVCGAKLAAGTG
eukprot:Sspe_Gene.38893::Locus_18754_Transcript_1_1_Confidence_1.000_Length_6623::g.38893::m.38893